VDLGLRDAWLATALADRNDVCGGAGKSKDLFGDQIVRKDDVGGFDEVCGAQCEQRGIAGACAYEVDMARFSIGD
jgi:hypothetical protein